MATHGAEALTPGEIAGFAETVDDLQFTERIDIVRDTSATSPRDELNQRPIPAPAPLHTDLACHYFERMRRERVGPDVIATVTDTRVIAPAGLDVTERDTILEIRTAAGARITGGRRIDRVLPRSYYTEIVIAGVNNAG